MILIIISLIKRIQILIQISIRDLDNNIIYDQNTKLEDSNNLFDSQNKDKNKFH